MEDKRDKNNSTTTINGIERSNTPTDNFDTRLSYPVKSMDKDKVSVKHS